MARLKEFYVKEVAPALMKKFEYKSVMQIPKLDKIVVSITSGEAKDNSKMIDAIVNDLGIITGQKATICRAK
ncbi:MAG: 50S ribosomal protein L5, partial [Ruminococcaceae bacterium]|nr:50S ribosomal protein L5 [Oscillospiraceae bacterium]